MAAQGYSKSEKSWVRQKFYYELRVHKPPPSCNQLLGLVWWIERFVLRLVISHHQREEVSDLLGRRWYAWETNEGNIFLVWSSWKGPLSFLDDPIVDLKNMENKNVAYFQQKEAGTKVLASKLFLDCRARRSGWVGTITLISSAFKALLNCAEVGRRNRILTNYRFLSHSLFRIPW